MRWQNCWPGPEASAREHGMSRSESSKNECARRDPTEFNIAFRELQNKPPTPPDQRHSGGSERMLKRRQVDTRPPSTSSRGCSVVPSYSKPVAVGDESMAVNNG